MFFTIKNSGLVIIGTKCFNSSEDLEEPIKLSVDGAVVAKEMLIETDASEWSDFVFDDEYNLLPLDELERNISENKKLPGIPSANEIQQSGINVEKMFAKLLQKIEELYLIYM